MQTVISHHHLEEKAYTYEGYRALIDQLFAEGKTTGENHNEAMLHYTKMNILRMNRLEKTTQLSENLAEVLCHVETPQLWVVLTEAWCGDAAQSLPVIQLAAQYNEHISLRLLLRDENPEVMDAYLTNGTRSIPKLIVLDAASLAEKGTWGPRPKAAQAIVDHHKANGSPHDVYVTEVQKWYVQNKTADIQLEIAELLKATH